MNLAVGYRLAEVGVLETPKLQGKYDTGQVSVTSFVAVRMNINMSYEY